MITSQGCSFVVYKGKKRAYNCYEYFCFTIVLRKSLKRGLILSRDSYEFTKTKISLSYLHPASVAAIRYSELLFNICIICCLNFDE